jgi:hypothetical protein
VFFKAEEETAKAKAEMEEARKQAGDILIRFRPPRFMLSRVQE